MLYYSKIRIISQKEERNSTFQALTPFMRNLLLGVQASLLVSQEKKIKYGLPSNMKIDTKRIYNLMGVKRKTTPYIIEKF